MKIFLSGLKNFSVSAGGFWAFGNPAVLALALLIFLITVIAPENGFGQTACSVTWTCTSSLTPSTSGNITAGAASEAGLTSTFGPIATQGYGGKGFYSTEPSAGSTPYILFSVSPTAGNSLTINSESFQSWTNDGTVPDNVVVYASTSSTFASGNTTILDQGYPNTGANTNTAATTVTCTSGQTLYFEILFYNIGSGSKFGATTVTLSGTTTALCTPPSTQASGVTISSLGSTTATLNLTRGNGSGGVVIVAYPGASAGTLPSSGTTYSGGTLTGGAYEYGVGGTALSPGYVVYNGAGNGTSTAMSINVSNLTANTQYTFVAYEFASTGTCFLTTTTGSVTATTNCSSSTAFSTTSPVTFTTSGCYVVPTGVTSLTTVACYGGGGGGGGASTVDDGDGSGAGGGGGGGGGYAGASSISVTAGQTIYVSVGGAGSAGGAGANGTSGGTTYVSYNGSIIAEATGGSFGYGASAPDGSMIYGAAGTGGTAVIGSTTHTGGNGAAGSGPGSPWGAVYGGGGGGGGGSTANGGTATANSNTGGTAGTGGGGVGGTGGYISSGSEDGGSAGSAGATWGAGGGGGAGESDDADNQSVSGANGQPGAVIFTFTYVSCTNPTIVTQPSSPAPVCAGTGTSFAVSASGTSLSYQWQVSTTGSSGTYTPISNSTVYGTTGIDIYSGVNTNTLTVNMALSTMNTYWYECVVSSSGGCPVTTTPAELQVSTPAVLNTAPGSITNTGATINGTN